MPREHNVREHTRVRNGRTETVRSHTRGNGNGGDNTPDPNRIPKLIVGGVVLFTLSQTGIGPIMDTVGNALDVFDTAKDVKEFRQEVNNTESYRDKDGNFDYKEAYKDIKSGADLEAEDLADILEHFHTKFSNDGVNTEKMKVITVDYEAFDSDKKYNKEILKQLSKQKGPVTFIAVYEGYLEEDQMQVEYDRASKIIYSNLEIEDSDYTQVKTAATTNMPNPGNLTIAITFE